MTTTHLPSDELQAAKAALRATALAAREALAPETAAALSAVIARNVTALPAFAAAQTICCYLAIRREVRTAEIIRQALAAGKRVALPRTLRGERRLALHLVDDLDGLVPGPYGILEPPASLPELDPAAVELFLIPGAAFDAMGRRLGYGGGCYDTLLPLSAGLRVALAYQSQMVPQVPVDAHDQRVDLIVTDAGIITPARPATATAPAMR